MAKLIGAVVKYVVEFFKGELFSSFVTTYAAPALLSAIYIAVAVVTGEYGPNIVIGAAIVFALGCVGSAAIEQQRYLSAVRGMVKTGKPLPRSLFPYRALLRRGPKPEIEVYSYNGDIAVIEVKNKGGDAVFWAQAQIIKVSKGEYSHYAPFQMLWQNIDDHKLMDAHRVVIEHDHSMRLLVAEYRSGEWGGTRLLILGDKYSVDGFKVTDYGESPVVFVDVRIHSDPPMESGPFVGGYKVHSPKGLYTVRFVRD